MFSIMKAMLNLKHLPALKGCYRRPSRRWLRCRPKAVSAVQNNLKNLAVFVSGTGSNFVKLHESCCAKRIHGKVVVVVTNNGECRAADFARLQNIPVSIFPPTNGVSEVSAENLTTLLKDEHQVDFILLAGYLKLLPAELVKAFPRSILNIHPALLPSFGGKGYYGMKVHEAVLKSGVKFSGATVHFVDEDYDKGSILDQRTAPVLPNDTAHTLGARVLKQEHELYTHCVSALCDGRVKWNSHQVPYIL